MKAQLVPLKFKLTDFFLLRKAIETDRKFVQKIVQELIKQINLLWLYYYTIEDDDIMYFSFQSNWGVK